MNRKKKNKKKKLSKAQAFLKELAVFSDAIGTVPLDFLGDEDFDQSGRLYDLVDLCAEFTSNASEIMREIIEENKLNPRRGQFWFM